MISPLSRSGAGIGGLQRPYPHYGAASILYHHRLLGCGLAFKASKGEARLDRATQCGSQCPIAQ